MGELSSIINKRVKTASGKTIEEIIRDVRSTDHTVITTMNDPVFPNGGIAVLRGTLAPLGAICRTTTIPQHRLKHRGPARVFHSDEDAHQAVITERVKPGDVVTVSDMTA